MTKCEQLSLWDPEAGFELEAPWAGWLPVEPGSVLRAVFDLYGELVGSVRVGGGRTELVVRRSVSWERPYVWVADGYPEQGGLRVGRLPGERPTRWEECHEEAGGWRVDVVVLPGSWYWDLVRRAGGAIVAPASVAELESAFQVVEAAYGLDGEAVPAWMSDSKARLLGSWRSPAVVYASVVGQGGSVSGTSTASGAPIMPVMSSKRARTSTRSEEPLGDRVFPAQFFEAGEVRVRRANDKAVLDG